MKKEQPQKIYQFIRWPTEEKPEVAVVSVLEYSAENAFTAIRQSHKGALTLAGYADAEEFISKLNGTKQVSKDYSPFNEQTEEQISYLVKFLKDNGYKVTRKKYGQKPKDDNAASA